MHVFLAVYFVTSLPFIFCRDALQFFIKNKKVENLDIKILRNLDNSTSTWVEYNYIFRNKEKAYVSKSTLKIGVFLNADNKFDCKMVTDNDNKTTISGYSIDIIENLRKSLNTSVDFTVIDNLTSLYLGEIDLITCYYDDIDDFSSNITELFPTLKSNIVLIYQPNRLNFTIDIFILTFAGSLWLVFFSILILLALCLRIATARYSKLHPKCKPWTWVEITLWAIAAACQQGLSYTPKGFVCCFIFLMGYVMSYLLNTGFAAAITSLLVQHEERTVHLNNIKSEGLHLISPHYVKFQTEEIKSRFLKTEYVNSLNEVFERLDVNQRIGIGPEILIGQYMVKNLNSEQISNFRTLKLNKPFIKGFLMLRNNSWKERITKRIIEMNEFGILNNMLRRNLRPTQIIDLNTGYSSASKEHVGSAILLFLGGVLMSLLFLVVEFVLYFYKRGRNRLGL